MGPADEDRPAEAARGVRARLDPLGLVVVPADDGMDAAFVEQRRETLAHAPRPVPEFLFGHAPVRRDVHDHEPPRRLAEGRRLDFTREPGELRLHVAVEIHQPAVLGTGVGLVLAAVEQHHARGAEGHGRVEPTVRQGQIVLEPACRGPPRLVVAAQEKAGNPARREPGHGLQEVLRDLGFALRVLQHVAVQHGEIDRRAGLVQQRLIERRAVVDVIEDDERHRAVRTGQRRQDALLRTRGLVEGHLVGLERGDRARAGAEPERARGVITLDDRPLRGAVGLPQAVLGEPGLLPSDRLSGVEGLRPLDHAVRRQRREPADAQPPRAHELRPRLNRDHPLRRLRADRGQAFRFRRADRALRRRRPRDQAGGPHAPLKTLHDPLPLACIQAQGGGTHKQKYFFACCAAHLHARTACFRFTTARGCGLMEGV